MPTFFNLSMNESNFYDKLKLFHKVFRPLLPTIQYDIEIIYTFYI